MSNNRILTTRNLVLPIFRNANNLVTASGNCFYPKSKAKIIVTSIVTREELSCFVQIAPFHESKSVSCLLFNLDASKVIAGFSDGCFIVWDWQMTWAPAINVRGHEDAVKSVALNTDETKLFSVSEDGVLGIWDMSTGTMRKKLACKLGLDPWP